jgi:hypothetical protein
MHGIDLEPLFINDLLVCRQIVFFPATGNLDPLTANFIIILFCPSEFSSVSQGQEQKRVFLIQEADNYFYKIKPCTLTFFLIVPSRCSVYLTKFCNGGKVIFNKVKSSPDTLHND